MLIACMDCFGVVWREALKDLKSLSRVIARSFLCIVFALIPIMERESQSTANGPTYLTPPESSVETATPQSVFGRAT